MEESLSDLIKEKEELDLQLQVLEASGRIVERTPGATTLEEAAQLTGRSWLDLLVEETGLAPDVVERIATQPMGDAE
jgi:hypothetical protein